MRPYAVACCLCGALALCGMLRPRAAPERAGPRDATPGRAATARVMGTSSCAGAACHGQDLRGPGGEVRRDEYRLWNLWDPHAHAYHALEGKRAQTIMSHLAAGGEVREATKDPRCLTCHTDPNLAVDSADHALRVHGVGCEGCHGSAERWLEPHHATRPPGKEKLEQLGMKNLGATGALAAVCAGCHAGAPPLDGRPAQEVTHDLLAAGHPRLHFELTVYLANLPPHWNVRAKARQRQPDFEARAWAAGQVATARTYLELLAYQARRDSPWPEFAAYDCEACHTPLRGGGKSPGLTFPMSRWSVALLTEAGQGLPQPAPEAKTIGDHLKELRELLEKPRSAPGQVAAQADAVAGELEAWEKAVGQWKGDPTKMMKRVGRHGPGDSWNWEEATQRYLALSALEQARHGAVPDERHQRIQNELRGLAEKLAFPPSYSGPKQFSEDGLLGHFRRIREQLGD
jgi:hypothetical protein